MTKFMEWLTVIGCVLCVWVALITIKIESNFTKEYFNVILYSPIIFVLLFGLYAGAIVLYRTFTFNNCDEAAAELQKEIIQAKQDLQRLGYKFRNK